MKYYAFLLLSFLYLPVINSQVVLEKDINEEAASSNPGYSVELNNAIYFVADDGIHGEELFKFDLTTQTHSIVADIKVGYLGSDPYNLFAFDNKIYFNAKYGNGSSRYLYVHDPADNSTQRLADMDNEYVSEPGLLFEFNGNLFFSAEFPGIETELGRYNPTTNQIELLADINPTGSSYPNFFTEYNGELWFVANDGSSSTNLRKYSPSTGQIELINYNSPSGVFANFNFLHFFDGKFFFRYYVQGQGDDMGIYDPVTNTFLDYPPIYPGAGSSSPSGFTEFDGKLFFAARTGAMGRELRVYDPTTDLVTLVEDLNPVGNGNPGEMFILDGKLYFTANFDNDSERNLYSLASSNAAVVVEGTIPNEGFNNYLSSLVVADGSLYLSGRQPITGTELYRFTPGVSGINLAADVNETTIGSDPYNFTIYNNKLYFGATEINSGREIWFYDPSTGDVEQLSNFPGNVAPYNLTAVAGKLYFSALDQNGDYGIIAYDDATGLFTTTSYITPNSTGGITDITAYNDKLFFKSDDDILGRELFSYDPNDNTYEVVADINPNGDGNPERFYVHENELYFQADDGTVGNELWKYNDGTGLFSLAADINPGDGGSNPDYFISYAGELYFSAYHPNFGYDLYSYNSNTGVLTQRSDISNNFEPRNMEIYHDKLFFSGKFNSSVNAELVYYDAATDEIVLTEDLTQGASNPNDLVVFNDKLYFSTYKPEYGRELWQYNDTTLSIVADIYPGEPESDPANLTLFNGKIYFSANDGIRGDEIWSIAECLNIFVSTEPQINTNGFGAIDLTIEGGLPPYTISWSNGATTEDLENLQAGEYIAIVSDASGCLSEITVLVNFETVATENIIDEQKVNLFPNPNSGSFTLDVGELKVEVVQIFDLSGRVFFQQTFSENTSIINLELNNTIAGIYFVKIKTPEGIVRKKFVVE